MLPAYFKSGDVISMETTAGRLVARLVDEDDPNFLEIRWDWPGAPAPTALIPPESR